MAIVLNAKGTSFPSYQIGKNGSTIYQGIDAPDPSLGNSGDVYLYANGASSNFYQKRGSTWSLITSGNMSGPGASTNNAIATYNGTTGTVLRDSGVTIDANQTLAFSKNSSTIKRASYILYGTTVDTTLTTLSLNGSGALIVLSNNTTAHFRVQLVGRRTDDIGNNYGVALQGMIVRDAGASSTALIGDPSQDVIVNPNNLNWNATVVADTTAGALSIQVTGEAAKNILWSAVVDTMEVI